MIIDFNYAFKIRLMTEMGGNLTQVEILKYILPQPINDSWL